MHVAHCEDRQVQVSIFNQRIGAPKPDREVRLAEVGRAALGESARVLFHSGVGSLPVHSLDSAQTLGSKRPIEAVKYLAIDLGETALAVWTMASHFDFEPPSCPALTEQIKRTACSSVSAHARLSPAVKVPPPPSRQ